MKKKFHKENSDYSLAHVLYQKLGTDWYAFTEVDGDCFMTRVDAETVEQAKLETQDLHKAEKQRRRAA
jgi:hypothetical protein